MATVDRNSVLAALKTQIAANMTNVNVIRTAAHPEEYWEDIVTTYWPSDVSRLVALWDGEAVAADDYEKGAVEEVVRDMAVEAWVFVRDTNPEQRDIKLCNGLDDIKVAMRTDRKLGGQASFMRSLQDVNSRDIEPPYAGGYIDMRITYRRKS